MRLSILESIKTNTLIFTFDDLTSLKKMKFSLYQKDVIEQYVIHTECMKIAPEHHLLVSVEQIQQQGLLIRMHDILECKSESFCLLKKQNGQFSRLPEESTQDLIFKEDFRYFICELAAQTDSQQSEMQMQRMQYLFSEESKTIIKKKSSGIFEKADMDQIKQLESQPRDAITKSVVYLQTLPRRKRALQATRIVSFSQKAFFKDKMNFNFKKSINTTLDQGSQLASESKLNY